MAVRGACMCAYELFIISYVNHECDREIAAAILSNITSRHVLCFPCRHQAPRAPQLPFPMALPPGQAPSPLLTAGRGGPGLWNAALAQNVTLAQTTGGSLVQKALQLTAQIAKQNQLKGLLPAVQPPRQAFTPILPLPVVEGDSDTAARLKEPLTSKTAVVPQRVEPVRSPHHVDFVPSPQCSESIPSPQPLKERHRMGSDDLLADENIEKMEKSYSDDESKTCLNWNFQAHVVVQQSVE